MINMEKSHTGALVVPVIGQNEWERNRLPFIVEYRTQGMRILHGTGSMELALYWARFNAEAHAANAAPAATLFIYEQHRGRNKKFDRWLVGAVMYDGKTISQWLEGQE